MALIRGTVTGDKTDCPPFLLPRKTHLTNWFSQGDRGDKGRDRGDSRCHTGRTHVVRIKRPPQTGMKPLYTRDNNTPRNFGPQATQHNRPAAFGATTYKLNRWTRTCSAKSQQENHHHGRLYLVWGDTGLMLPTSTQSRESDWRRDLLPKRWLVSPSFFRPFKIQLTKNQRITI